MRNFVCVPFLPIITDIFKLRHVYHMLSTQLKVDDGPFCIRASSTPGKRLSKARQASHSASLGEVMTQPYPYIYSMTLHCQHTRTRTHTYTHTHIHTYTHTHIHTCPTCCSCLNVRRLKREGGRPCLFACDSPLLNPFMQRVR